MVQKIKIKINYLIIVLCILGVSGAFQEILEFWPLERSVYFNLFLVILPKFGSIPPWSHTNPYMAPHCLGFLWTDWVQRTINQEWCYQESHTLLGGSASRVGITLLNWQHKIDWDSAECATYSINYQRLTLESWYTNLVQETVNRCQTTTSTLQTTYAWPQTSTDRRNNKTTTDQSLQLWSLGDKTSRQKWQQQKTRPHA